MEPILWFVAALLITVLVASFGGDTITQLVKRDSRILNTTRASRENVRVALDETPARYKILNITPLSDDQYQLTCKSVAPPFVTKDITVSITQIVGDYLELMHTGRGNLKYIPSGRRLLTNEEYDRFVHNSKEVIRLRGEVSELKAMGRKTSQVAVDQATQLAGTQRGGYQ